MVKIIGRICIFAIILGLAALLVAPRLIRHKAGWALECNPSEIRAITITRRQEMFEPVRVFQPRGAGTSAAADAGGAGGGRWAWAVEQAGQAMIADEEMVSRYRTFLCRLTYEEKFALEAAAVGGRSDAADYGIDENALSATLKMYGGEEVNVRLGRLTPDTSGRYFVSDRTPNMIYILNSRLAQNFEAGFLNFRHKNLFPAQSDINRVVFKLSEFEEDPPLFAVERAADDSWTVVPAAVAGARGAGVRLPAKLTEEMADKIAYIVNHIKYTTYRGPVFDSELDDLGFFLPNLVLTAYEGAGARRAAASISEKEEGATQTFLISRRVGNKYYMTYDIGSEKYILDLDPVMMELLFETIYPVL